MSPASLLNWMLLSTALLGAWWACYRLALRQERSFAYNRAFLVLGPVLAAGLPLLPLAWPAGWWGTGAAGLGGLAAVLLPAVPVSATSPAAAPAAAGWGGAFWLPAAYLGGAAWMLTRLALALGRLWLSTRRLPRAAHPGYTLARTHGRLPTSSFGRTVFWDETLALSPTEAAQVLAHELAHVRQGHTYDRLLLELLRAGLWFNPFVHRCGRALALTHEFLADEAALATASPMPVQSTAYSQLLARQVAGRLGFSVPLAHTFSHSQTLSRIAMLQKTSPIRRWKQWLALPLVAAFFVAAASGRAAAQPRPAAATQQAAPPPPVVFDNPEVFPELPGGGGPAAIVTYIQQHLAYPTVAPAARRSGRLFVSFTVTDQGEVQAPKILKGLGPEYDAAVLAAIAQLPRFVPGTTAGRPVAVSFTVPVQFAVAAPAKAK